MSITQFIIWIETALHITLEEFDTQSKDQSADVGYLQIIFYQRKYFSEAELI